MESEEDIHLGLLQYLMILTGIWPLKLNNPIYAVMYRIHFYFCEIWMTYFVITLMVNIPNSFEQGFDTIIENFMFTIIHTVSWLKRLICQSKNTIDLINGTKSKRFKILQCGNSEIIAIYTSQMKIAEKLKRTLIVIAVLWYSAYTVFKYLQLIYFWDDNNVIIIVNSTKNYIKPTPVESWKPFNTNEHYNLAFWIDIISPFLGVTYMIMSYALYVDFIMYILCLIRILQFFLRNFQEYSTRIQLQHGTNSEQASYTTIKTMIIEHKYILSLMDQLNVALRNLILLEYIVNSIIISIVLINIIQKTTFYVIIFPMFYLIVMVTQLLSSYYQANQIALEHSALSMAIYDSNWYEQSPKVKECMLIMMIRTQRELALSIGPFYPMRIESALSCLKAAYSYVTLMKNTRLGE